MNEAKKSARQDFRARRMAVEPAERQRFSDAICRYIAGLPEYQSVRHVTLYASDGVEPELLPLLADRSKCFWMPRYDGAARCYRFCAVSDPEELIPGKYGLPEPPPAAAAAGDTVMQQETLHLVPGIAYDRRGTRLGRGGGFYDRLLAGVVSPVCGVFFACQKADDLPQEAHDRPLDMVVTECGVERFVRVDKAGNND